MPKFTGTSEVPYTHDGGTVCLGDVVELTNAQAARGLASGRLTRITQAPEIAPEPTVPEPNEEV